jgi:hypothetical protein
MCSNQRLDDERLIDASNATIIDVAVQNASLITASTSSDRAQCNHYQFKCQLDIVNC